MSRILITGASGFIGRATVAVLANAGHVIRAAVRRKSNAQFAAGVEIVQHPDLIQDFDWHPFLEGVEEIIHLAGVAHSGRGIESPLYDRVNRRATAQLAEAAGRAGIKRFLFVSSVRAQSGPVADHALTEHDPPMPTDAYGRSKLAAEAAVVDAGVPFTILRPVQLYGLGMKGGFALLARAAQSPWPLPLKDFKNRRALLGIENFISALNFVLTTSAAAGETYLLADPGMPPPLSEVTAILRRAHNRRPLLLPMPPHYVEIPLRMVGRGDVWERFGGNLRVDITKLLRLGWQPAHDTTSGLTALAQAQRRAARA